MSSSLKVEGNGWRDGRHEDTIHDACDNPKTFDCTICKAELRTQRDLDNHRCLAHDDCGEARLGTPITFRCATCGEAFTRRGDLYAHQRESAHGNPEQWDKARPPGTPRPRGRQRKRAD